MQLTPLASLSQTSLSGLDGNAPDKCPEFPKEYPDENNFLAACRTNCAPAVEWLLKADPSRIKKVFISSRTNGAVTGLSLAIERNHKRTVSVLIAADTKQHMLNKRCSGFTPLGLACYYGHPEIIDLFIKAKVDATAICKSAGDRFRTPLSLLGDSILNPKNSSERTAKLLKIQSTLTQVIARQANEFVFIPPLETEEKS